MAFTPTLVNNVCHPSLAAAANAYFGAIPVDVSVSAGVTTVIEYLFYVPSLSWTIKSTSYSLIGTPSTNFWRFVTAPAFPDCDLTAAYFDGMQMGWGVVAAMAAALAIIFLKNALVVR